MGDSSLNLQTSVVLSTYTSINLGGAARYFVRCESIPQLRLAIARAREERWRLHILGGGTNTIFSDAGFDGLVIRIAIRGIDLVQEGEDTLVTAAAGEEWDPLVRFCVERKLAGIESLSGIPGLAGATPIQNVGAYGQEVSETIVRLKALDLHTMEECVFPGPHCGFGYRKSRFKSRDAGRYVITDVTFRLKLNGKPTIRYPELLRSMESLYGPKSKEPDPGAVRSAVLALRSRKSMVIDPTDPNTRSVGSFFMNPVLSHEDYAGAAERWKMNGVTAPPPTFPAETGLKISAAWLVEQSGYPRGYRKGGVGVSANHSLALVNYAGSTAELLSLADDIENSVRTKFGIRLEREPVIVG